jgi:hypothetical protein
MFDTEESQAEYILPNMTETSSSSIFIAPFKKSPVQACKTRTILREEQAVQIFEIKLANSNSGIEFSKRLRPEAIAKHYGISTKAVRDIWIGRTWLRETMHLDPALAALASRLRPPGRPRVRAIRRLQPIAERCRNESCMDSTLSTIANGCLQDDVVPLPQPSSCADDPFHDDWGHWHSTTLVPDSEPSAATFKLTMSDTAWH